MTTRAKEENIYTTSVEVDEAAIVISAFITKQKMVEFSLCWKHLFLRIVPLMNMFKFFITFAQMGKLIAQYKVYN
jgi:hypothetical protein